PSRFEVFSVVGDDFVHQFLPLSLVASFRRFDERCHCPCPAVFCFLALESNIVLDHFEAETWQGQDDRLPRYREQIHKISSYTRGDASEIAKSPSITLQIGLLIRCPVNPRDVTVRLEDLLCVLQETDPTLFVAVSPES